MRMQTYKKIIETKPEIKVQNILKKARREVYKQILNCTVKYLISLWDLFCAFLKYKSFHSLKDSKISMQKTLQWWVAQHLITHSHKWV